jgi:hypothetical protein
MPRSVWEALDLTLSRLRLSTVELHVYGPPENLPNRDDAVCFPQSSAKDIVRAPALVVDICTYQLSYS